MKRDPLTIMPSGLKRPLTARFVLSDLCTHMTGCESIHTQEHEPADVHLRNTKKTAAGALLS